MNKLGVHFPPYEVDIQSNPASLPPAPQPAGAGKRLIVLVPAEANYPTLTQRVWELANGLACHVLFLSLCTDPVQESGLRRQLATMSAMVQDARVCADARIETGSSWVNAVKSNAGAGDMIVCFAEQRAGLLQRPMSQILQANLEMPVYVLSGLSPQKLARPHWLSQTLGWIGSVGIIAGAFLLQIQILSLSKTWAQTTLLILSMLGEIGLIWGWNSLLS